MTDEPVSLPATMRAIRLKDEGLDGLVTEQTATPEPGAGEAIVRVHAAAITRDELEWPTDRLPAIPSYELSGVVVAAGPGVDESLVGEAVYALTPFDRDGAAADYAAVPSELLAPKPRSSATSSRPRSRSPGAERLAGRSTTTGGSRRTIVS